LRKSSNYRTSPPERVAWPINDGAFRLGVSRATIYKLAGDGKIRLIKVGGRRLIPDAEITRLASGAGA
jgi:excisionase family DNA binding protein